MKSIVIIFCIFQNLFQYLLICFLFVVCFQIWHKHHIYNGNSVILCGVSVSWSWYRRLRAPPPNSPTAATIAICGTRMRRSVSNRKPRGIPAQIDVISKSVPPFRQCDRMLLQAEVNETENRSCCSMRTCYDNSLPSALPLRLQWLILKVIRITRSAMLMA